MADTGRIYAGFRGESVAIDWRGLDALHLAEFLCSDLDGGKVSSPRAVFQLSVDRDQSQFLLLENKHREVYSGADYYELAYNLINEIIYQVIVDNNSGLAIHAAALSSNGKGVLLPGGSGSGKSTFTAWLLSRGCNYLTDELVVLDRAQKKIEPFTRPLSIKTGSLGVIKGLIERLDHTVIEGPAGMMLPHRLLNPNFTPLVPSLSLILFPKYSAGMQTEITRLSGAIGCGRLLECYVNARNIKDHGIDILADFVRTTPVYQLTYSTFDGLAEQLTDSFPSIFP